MVCAKKCVFNIQYINIVLVPYQDPPGLIVHRPFAQTRKISMKFWSLYGSQVKVASFWFFKFYIYLFFWRGCEIRQHFSLKSSLFFTRTPNSYSAKVVRRRLALSDCPNDSCHVSLEPGTLSSAAPLIATCTDKRFLHTEINSNKCYKSPKSILV
jgi:hypothetical protein